MSSDRIVKEKHAKSAKAEAVSAKLDNAHIGCLSESTHGLANRFFVGIFFVAVALAPLPYGSRDAATVSLWCILLGIALIGAPMRHLGQPQRLFSCGIILVLCATAVVLHEQLSPAPWFAAPDPLWRAAAQALGKPLHPFASIVSNEPLYACGPMLEAVLALWLGLIFGADRQRARRLLYVVAVSGTIYAIYGILSTLFTPTLLLLREREAYVGNLTGTFVNRNTAATYFGACTLIWLILFLERVRKMLPSRFSRRISIFEAAALSRRIDILSLFGTFLICLTALFMTSSRAGIILSMATMVGAITVYIGLDRTDRRGVISLFAIACAIIASLYAFLGGALDARFGANGLGDIGRFETYRATLRLIADHPWFGTGLGTFNWAFPAYRSADVSMRGIWDLAHSTPLELAADLGLPLAVMIGVAWLTILWTLAHGVFVRRRDAAIPLSAFCVALVGLLHSAIDFSFQVPGFAVVAMAVVGVGLAQSFSSGQRAA